MKTQGTKYLFSDKEWWHYFYKWVQTGRTGQYSQGNNQWHSTGHNLNFKNYSNYE